MSSDKEGCSQGGANRWSRWDSVELIGVLAINEQVLTPFVSTKEMESFSQNDRERINPFFPYTSFHVLQETRTFLLHVCKIYPTENKYIK